MTDKQNDTNDKSIEIQFEREKLKKTMGESTPEPEIVKKEFVPNFFPTYRISRRFYPLPIIIVIFCAGFLAYVTYVLAGVQIEGGYVSEEEHGIAAGLINGLIFVGIAAISSFIIIFLVKKGGIDVLKYIFGFSFGLLGFILTLFFGGIIIFLLFLYLPEIFITSYIISSYILLFGTGVFTIFIIYRYFTTKSILTKNLIILYISLLTGAFFGILMPLWTTLAILIGISLWDIFAVKSKRGPIKEMIDIASQNSLSDDLTEEELQEKIDSGEMIYDTSKLEIGIGDLAFYSMLTSAALIITGSLIVMILTTIAIMIGTGITIQGLKKNKILPGLPISIFLGISTMLLSWYIVSIL